ncbi:Protein O-glucosyltransferase 2 [Microbotryomycetes sp. JL201]|nr:Protein O-glucosyltransferase 2 [Microbotryomycetes sp. JL201]
MRSASLGRSLSAQSSRSSLSAGQGQQPRRASSHVSLYPYSGSSSAYTSHPRLSIRTPVLAPEYPSTFSILTRPFTKGRTSKRATFTLIACILVLFIIWGQLPSSRRGSLTSARGANGPFDLLHFQRKGGFLYYPGHATKEREKPNGVIEEVEYVPEQPHPIHLLIDKAKRDWDKKLKRQSTSLADAVDEYERRYGRRPPKGFAEWWDFAQQVNFQMPDEFDSLNENLLPFLALPPSKNQERSEKIQFDKDFWIQDKAFTIQIQDGAISVHGPMARSLENPDERSTQAHKMIKDLAGRLPDMNVTVTGHDNPWVVLSGEARSRLKSRGRGGLLIEKEEEDEVHDNWDYDGWAVACPPHSPLRSEPRFDERVKNIRAVPERHPSFIQDHVAAMDLCDHPTFQPIHGFSAWPGPRPGLLYPLFTFTRTAWHADLLMPPIDQYDRPIGNDPDWEDKKHDKMSEDATLSQQSGNLTLQVAAKDKDSMLGPVEDFDASAQELAASYFDVKFLGKPQQCGDACDEIQREFEWDKWMSADEQNEYKYVIDVDGNGWSGRFHRLMTSKSLVLKSTIFPEWYADRIQPWLHYVPIAPDYSDLWAAMAFFKGDLAGRGAHDAMAKEIAYNGRQWAAEFWRWEDMQVYLYRLLLEYARIMLRSEDNLYSMDM